MKKNLIGAASIAVLLAGCSGEPSAGDLATALTRTLAESGNGILQSTVHGVEKIGCESTAQDKAFLCDVRADVTPPVGPRAVRTARLRVVKASDGWVATGAQ